MIELYHVTKAYERDIVALSDINLKIKKGEFQLYHRPERRGQDHFFKNALRG